MEEKSQRLIENAIQKPKESTPRIARAYNGVFSIDGETPKEYYDNAGAYRITLGELVVIGFLFWFISVI